jgi:tetratricopeptide (TPR) repeat protein
VAERFLYIASISFTIALTNYLQAFRQPFGETVKPEMHGKSPELHSSAYTLHCQTITRNKDWKSEISLFTHDLKYLDKSAKAHYILANALKSEMIEEIKQTGDQTGYEGRVERINTLLKQTTEIYPGYFEAWNTLGEMSSMMQQDYDQAFYYFGKAAEVKPTYAPAWFNMGYAHQQLGRYREAIPCYWKAFNLDTTDVRTLSNLEPVTARSTK